jgi:hypothetical protein
MRLLPLAWFALSSGPAPFGSTHLVEDGGSLLGEFGPFARPRPIDAAFEHTIGDCDLAARPVCLWAPSAPGRAAAAISVEGGFDVERVVAPHGPAGGRVRGRADPSDQMFRRVVGERGDPVGTGVGECGVDLGEGGVDLPPSGVEIGNELLAPLLVLDKGRQTLPKVAFNTDGLLYPGFGASVPIRVGHVPDVP